MPGQVKFASGGTGPFRNQIAWFDFGGGDINTGVTSLDNDIPGVGKITLEVNKPSSTTNRCTFGGGGGQLFGGAYTGVGGNPAIYVFSDGGDSGPIGTVIVQNIKILDLNGSPLNYSLITGDSETTVVPNEFLSWTTNGPAWSNLGFSPQGGGPYASDITGIGTQTVTSTVVRSGDAQSPILSSANATQLTIRTLPRAGEGAGVGFLLNYATLKKIVDKGYSTLNDTLTYTLVLFNNTTSSLNGAITDNLNNNIQYIPNTLTINGSPSSTSPPNISISNIGSSQTFTIQFKAKVISLPSNLIVPNSASFSGSGSGTTGNISAISNNVVTTISYLDSIITKFVDVTLVALTTTITYTIKVTNTGNIPMPNPMILDTIPNGTVYIPGTLTNALGDPNTTILLPTIPVSSTHTITFKVKVTSIPCPNPIPNNSTVMYSYKVDPNSPDNFNGGNPSNEVTTLVGFADLSSKKYVNRNYVTFGDTITYTIAIVNSGADFATNILFIDTIPDGTMFLPSSFSVNNVIEPNVIVGTSPVQISPIAAGSTSTITFSVIAVTLPKTNPTLNTGSLSYFDGTPNVTKATNTNIVSTTIVYIDNQVTKFVDSSIVPLNTTLTYTVVIQNIGNIIMPSPILIDTIPNGTIYINNSLTGASGSPQSQIQLSDIQVNQSATISYKVFVTSVPMPNPIPNKATLFYNYRVDPNISETRVGTGISNTVTTLVGFADVSSIKYVDKIYATTNDIIMYTIVTKNTGAGFANNVKLFDTLPIATSFVNNSLTINDIPQSGGLNPAGILLPNIPFNQSVTVTFKVLAETFPLNNPTLNSSIITFTDDTPNVTKSTTTNIVGTTISVAILSSQKFVDTMYSYVNNTITYTIILKNSGNVPANNLTLFDTIPLGGVYVANSLKQDNQLVAGTPSGTGLNFPNSILPSNVSTITFQVTFEVVPTINPAINSATFIANYTADPQVTNFYRINSNTNSVSTTIIFSEVLVSKFVDKIYADCSEIITYTIALKNTGNTPAVNILFIDTIPTGTLFVENSLSVDGILRPSTNPQLGVIINNIPVASSSTITYSVKVMC